MASSQVGSVYIRVRPETTGFRREAQDKIRAQGPIEATADVETSREQIAREMRSAQRDVDRHDLTADVDLDVDTRLRGLERAIENLEGLREVTGETQRTVREMQDGLNSLADQFHEIRIRLHEDDWKELERRLEDLTTQVQIDISEATRDHQQWIQERSLESIENDANVSPNLSSAVAARQALSASMRTIPVQARLSAASFTAVMAQLHALGHRPITVDVHPRIPISSILRLEAQLLAMSQRRVMRTLNRSFDRAWRTWAVGGARSLAGLGDMDEMMHAFDQIISQLDVLGSKAALMGTAIGTAVNVATHALGGLIVTVADASRVVGLLAAAPTAILAAWAGFHTHRSIWQDFGAALEGDLDALERIPPNGQRAVDAINALSEAVNRSIQDGFWEVMADEITRFAETIGPILERNMQRTAEIYGESLSSMLDITQEFAESGALGAAFSNINRFFEGIGGGAVDLFDAFVTVGLRASHMMPRLGHEFEQLGSAINQYMQWAVEMGLIERWIHQGVETTRQLGDAAVSVGQIFQGLTQTFRNAGIIGLPAMVSGLQQAADFMQSMEAQTRLGHMFSGMVDGARMTWEGVERLATALYNSHEWARQLSVVIGEIARSSLFRMGEFLENTTFQGGMLDLFHGARDAIDFLVVGTQYLADIVGNLGSISGEILREMAPGVETLLGIFADLSNALTPLIVESVGPLTDFIDNLGHSVRNNVNTVIIPALTTMLEMFNRLPAPLQNMLALWAASARWLPALSNATSRAFVNLGNAMRGGATSVALSADALNRNRRALLGVDQQVRNSLLPLRQATRQYQRTGQIIAGTYTPTLRSATAMSNLAVAASRTAEAAREVPRRFTAVRTSMDRSMRGARPLTRAWIGMSNTANNVTTGIQRGFAGMSQVFGRTVDRVAGDARRMERSLARSQAAMSRFRGTGQLNANYMGGATIMAPMVDYRAADSSMRRVEARAQTMASRIGSSARAIGPAFANAWSGMGRVATTAYQSVERTWTRLPGMIGGAARGAAASAGAAFMTIPAMARTAASGVSTALVGPLMAAQGVVRGLTGLLRGMFTLIGGVPGIALIGILTALGSIRNAAAEARREVDQFYQALQSGGTEGMREAILDAEGVTDALIKAGEAGFDANAILQDMMNGVSVQPLIDDLDDLQSLLTNGIDGVFMDGDLDAWLEKLGQEFPHLKELWDSIDWTMADVSMDDSQGLIAWINEYARDIESAGESAEGAHRRMAGTEEYLAGAADSLMMTGAEAREYANNMAEAGNEAHQASTEAQRFSSSLSDIGNASVGADQQLSSLRQAMSVLGDGLTEPVDIAVEAWDHYANALRTAEAMTEATGSVIGSAADGISSDWEDMSERQRLAIQGASELHDVAMARALLAYNDAIAGGRNHADAIDMATAAYGDLDGEIAAFAEAAGMSAEEVEAFRAQVEGLHDVSNLELVLSLTNLSEMEIEYAYDGLQRLHEAGAAIDQAEWFAFIAANPDQAILAIENTEMALLNFEGHQWITSLNADEAAAIEALARAQDMGEGWDSGDYAAILRVIEELDVDEALALLNEWDDSFVEAHLGTDDAEARENLGSILESLGDYEGEYSAHIDLEGDILDTLQSIDRTLRDIAETHYGIEIETDDSALDDTIEKLHLTDDLHVMPYIGLNDDEFSAKEQTNRTLLENFDARTALPWLGLEDSDFVGKESSARGALTSFPMQTNPTLGMIADGFFGTESDARGLMNSFPNKQAELTLRDRATAVAGAASRVIQGVRDKRVAITARSNAGAVAGATNRSLGGIRNRSVAVSVRANGVGGVLGALNRIPRNITTTVRTVGGGAGAWRGGFADGGLLDGRFNAFKFANGGGLKEVHRAQIAQGATPYRVWAEPETGGEAYIPLAASKRARSLDIWEETGRRLGAPQMQEQQAVGVGSTYAPQVNVQVHHPRPEATSRTVQRTLDYIGGGVRP